MSDCIRRPHSYWTTCTCDSCVIDRRRTRKRFESGHPYRISSEQAWEVLADRIERDWSGAAIASACGLRETYLSAHLAQYRKGRRVHIGPMLAKIIMDIGTPTAGLVGAEPTRRRLQALGRIGYTLERLTAETGIGATTLAMCRTRNRRIRATMANAVSDAYDRLHMIPGGNADAVRLATSNGYAPPLAWDDIDDLDEQPQGMQTGKPARSVPTRDQLASSRDHRSCPRCGVIREVRRASDGICADCKPLMDVAS